MTTWLVSSEGTLCRKNRYNVIGSFWSQKCHSFDLFYHLTHLVRNIDTQMTKSISDYHR